MNFSKKEEKIVGPFYRYIAKPKPQKELYLLKWKYGTTVYAFSDIVYESDNNLELDDPNYEDFISIIMKIKKIINLDNKDGFNWIADREFFEFNYHNFPNEIYNSKGELISKRED